MKDSLFHNHRKTIASAIYTNRLFHIFVTIITVTTFLLIIGLLYNILGKGLPKLSLDFLVKLPDELEAGGGIGPFLFNSFYVLILSLILSLPIGIGAGIFLAEYAPNNRFTEFVRTSVESLASVPSIVFGLFGYVLFVEYVGIGLTIIGAAITLALLNLPVLARVTEEAIQAVPQDIREASLALGATKSQTILKVVLPAALNGILTGISLVACRAFGESAIIILAGGTSTSGFMWDFNLLSQGGTLPVHLWYVQSEALVPDAKEIAEKSAAILVLIVLMISFTVRFPLWIQTLITKIKATPRKS
ncbi:MULTISPECIES: phosphate ABC transporter permease PstA [Anoxybacillus]|uniref:Phosphate transport system permease protein PstA n=1 Tax=Anoxybacillus ayderensis TaxID=265546 RepID=A0A0D0HS77_9BACL|nr:MULTISPECIES: phosphate ABC transporter permease PstA [Anoxybacillus]KHF27609.1 Phosphate transport system permease protein PstA [Anoxybacillus sp. BCO1]EPZ38863.1 phosphate ABC transporter, inner membrane subunit PstA [Anoxybacillus ayderensis]KIP20738.1 Phosphate transport system permease protein pstA [Anoxybacillus ayderensis]MBA2879305.1 phosphate transport system permease protein [Anoxybacillus ayderensis]MED0657018.1 phosphate ABC transporter permease PstA [Anoxybacillus ayderensis]